MVHAADGEPRPDDGGVAAPDPTTDLEQRAAELLQAAEATAAATGRAMVAEARGVRRRMLEDAEQRRRQLVAELERVRRMLDDAIAALSADAAPVGDEPNDDAPAHPTADQDDQPEAEHRDEQDAEQDDNPVDAPVGEPVGALFARLRSEPMPPRPTRAPRPKPPTAAAKAPDSVSEPEPDSDVAEPEPDSEPASEPEPEEPDAAARRRRASRLEPLVPDVVRASKRLLQDEQNTLLDAVRRARGRPEPGRLLPDLARQRDAWVEMLGPGADGAYLGGRAAVAGTGRATGAPARVVVELVAFIVMPLRERLTQTIEGVVSDGPYESSAELQRVAGSAIGARYREWRSADLETRVLDVLCAAYARGSYDGAGPATSLRWVPDEPGRCPDCDDNALEPTPKGGAFPTGQNHPPAHPGCRCLVVLAE
jgi:hypothetical protein